METLLFMIAADIAVSTALATYQIKAREKILERWKRGNLSMTELLWLKKQLWFRNLYMKKLKVPVDTTKKEN